MKPSVYTDSSGDYVRNQNQIKVNPSELIIVHVCHVDLPPILSCLALVL